MSAPPFCCEQPCKIRLPCTYGWILVVGYRKIESVVLDHPAITCAVPDKSVNSTAIAVYGFLPQTGERGRRRVEWESGHRDALRKLNIEAGGDHSTARAVQHFFHHARH